MSKQLQGHLAIISANIIFGLSIPITKKLIDHWVTPSSYTFMRLAVGAIIFWSIGALVKKEKVSKRDLLIIAVGGFFGFVATQLLFATALQYTTPVYFSLIMALTPILVLLMSLLFLKEIFTKNKILGVALSIGGAALIILTGGSSAMASNNKFGIMLSFLAALSYGIYMIVTKDVSVKYKPITIIKWSFLFSAMMLFPFEILALPKQTIFTAEATLNSYLLLIFCLVFITALGFLLMPMGLKYIKATTASIYMNFQPIVASVVAILLGQDVFSWEKPMAAVLVIAGVIFVSYNPDRKNKSKKSQNYIRKLQKKKDYLRQGRTTSAANS
ncbi:DMT family transporter [Mesonia sp.]|uniref:DMT family transporter n=2 Tax=Mesonia sp. TaxID=1960830 RepID=UPI003F9A3068